MSFVSKSKNTVPLDKPIPYPQPDILSEPLISHKLEFTKQITKLEPSLSMKKFDQIRQTGIVKSENSMSKTKLNVTPPKNQNQDIRMHQPNTPEPCFGITGTLSQSPSTQICGKPILKSDEGLRNENAQLKVQVNEQFLKIEQIQNDQKELQKFIENEQRKIKMDNLRLSDENKQLYLQIDEMMKDIDYIREGLEQKDEECQNLRKQNQQQQDELRQIMSERNKTNYNSDLIQKEAEIEQLQIQIQEYLEQLQQKDGELENTIIQLECIRQENQQLKNTEQMKNMQSNLSNLSNLSSRRQSSQSEIIFYQAQLEQREKEKQICEDKLVEMQTTIHILQEKKNNNQNSQISNKEISRMKQVIQIQKRQIESQQKTIMNQHFEIQNLQTLLYNSTDQDSQYNKKSYCSNDFDNNSVNNSKIEDVYHIKDSAKEPIKFNFDNNNNGNSPQQSFQKCAVNYIQEDTFRNIEQYSERN